MPAIRVWRNAMPKAFLGLAALLAAIVPALAAAAEPVADPRGFYLGAGAGASRAEDWCGPYFDTVVLTCDNSTVGYKLYGGYRFNEFLGVEAAYLDLGELRFDGLYLGTPVTNLFDLRGATLQAVFHLPITREFSVLGKAGGIYWDLTNETTLPGFAASSGRNGFDVALGAGVQYFLTRHFALRAEYEYFPNLGSLNSVAGDVDQSLFTVGALWKF
jgi:OOP family OmpA-OmpF porin